MHARIERIDGYSAHADEGELLDFIGKMPRLPVQIFVVHVEADVAPAFADKLTKLGVQHAAVPQRGQEFEV